MIKKQSDDPDVEVAASQAEQIIKDVLSKLPKAEKFDYGGHILDIGEYEVCDTCTSAIAEAQQAHMSLVKRADEEQDSVIKEHLVLAAKLFKLEAEVAVVHDDYKHSHREGE
jgi:hypothetical protein